MRGGAWHVSPRCLTNTKHPKIEYGPTAKEEANEF